MNYYEYTIYPGSRVQSSLHYKVISLLRSGQCPEQKDNIETGKACEIRKAEKKKKKVSKVSDCYEGSN